MKICIVSEREYGCGASIAAYRLAKSLADVGHEVHYIFDQPFPGLDHGNLTMWPLSNHRKLPLGILHTRGIRRFGQKLYVKGNFAQTFFILRKILNKIKPDIINLHNVGTILTHANILKLLRQFPVVWTMHDLFAIKPYNYQFVNLAGQTVETTVISKKFVDKKSRLRLLAYDGDIQFVSPSAWLRDTVLPELEKFNKKIHVIPYGLSRQDFFPEDKRQSREKLGLPVNGFYALFVAGNINYERKNIRILLDALPHLPQEIKILALGAVDSDFRRQHPYIRFFSSHFDISLIRKLYSAADVFILPSLIDNLPNAVIESLFCGTPIVGANAGGIPEMVIPGKTGWLFNPHDSKELAAILGRIYQQPTLCSEKSAQCVDWAQQRFSLETQRDRYLDLFSSLLQ